MSKKKNTLKDLDEFLKQQAATLVPPTPLADKVEAAAQPAETKPAPQNAATPAAHDVSLDQILEDLESLSQKEGTTFRKKVYDLILQAAESGQQSLPEDKMLINTVLYLTSGPRWKDAVREYWRKK
jgi:hypothetical protein